MVPTWLHSNRTNFYNFQFVLMLVAFQLRNPATGWRKANANPIFSLAISVLEYYTARNVVPCFGASSAI